MDAHMEVTIGWLEPLLERLHFNRNTTAISIIHTISMETLAFETGSESLMTSVNGFTWDLIVNWIDMSASEKQRRKNPNDPIRSPTMLGERSLMQIPVGLGKLFVSGGFFAIDKDYFELLGMYDTGFEIWGAENLE